MDAQELIRNALKAVAPNQASKLGNIRAETRIQESGLDSVAIMEMVGYLEEQLSTQFSDEVLLKIQTFGDLETLVRTHMGK